MLALAIIGISAGRLYGQSTGDIYLIGTSITAPGNLTGFERYNDTDKSPLYLRSPIFFIIRSLENSYEIEFSHFCFNPSELMKIRPVQSDDIMQIVTVSESLLSSYNPIDVADFLATKTKAQAEAWREENQDKKVWIIDRSHGYGNGTMTLIETRIFFIPLTRWSSN